MAGTLNELSLVLRAAGTSPESPEVGILLNNLAKVQENENNSFTASRLYSRAIEIFDKCGQGCPENAAIAFANAGSVLAGEQLFSGAETAERHEARRMGKCANGVAREAIPGRPDGFHHRRCRTENFARDSRLLKVREIPW
jgi:hypothetical protein